VIEFVVSMVDKVTGPAKMAGSSMLSVATQAKTLQAALAGAEKSQLKAAALGNVRGFQKSSKDIDMLKAAIGQVPKATDGMDSGLSGLLGKLTGLGEMGPAAFAEIGLAAYAAIGAVVVAGAALALQASGLRAQLVATFDSLGGGAGAGEKVVGMLNELAGRLPQTRAQLADWAKTLMAAGVSASAVPGKLEAIASAQAMMGTEGADKLAAAMAKLETKGEIGKAFKMGDLTKLIAGTGVAAKDVTAQLKAMGVTGAATNEQVSKALELAAIGKGKGALANMAGSLGSMGDKFKENISMLFEGVDVKPFTAGLKSVLDLFSQSTASGKAMKLIVTATFNAIFAVASAVFPVIKSMILNLVIVALRIYIAMKPAVAVFKALFAAAGGMKTLVTVLKVVAAAVAVFVGILVLGLSLVLAPLAVAVGAVVAFGAAMLALPALIGGAVLAVGAFFLSLPSIVEGVVTSALTALNTFASGGTDAAGNFISGLVSGITGGAAWVVSAVSNLASSVIGAFTSKMKIQSPSKVMATLGGHTAMGVAKGMDAGATHVEAASEGLADAAAGSSAPELPKGAPSGGGGKSGGGSTITIAAGAIQIKGAGSNGEALTMTEQALAGIFDRIAAKEGLAA